MDNLLKKTFFSIANLVRCIWLHTPYISLDMHMWSCNFNDLYIEYIYLYVCLLLYTFREQYAAWKAVCQKMVPTIGSGKFITTPIITDDGHPVQDPSANTNVQDNNGATLDQREIQWKLSLPQIGLCLGITWFSHLFVLKLKIYRECYCVYLFPNIYFIWFIQPSLFESLLLMVLVHVFTYATLICQIIVIRVPALWGFWPTCLKGCIHRLLIRRADISNLGLDVVRTDRTLVYYENEANQAKLWDVLAVYAWVDKDIGYVQGNYLC